MSAEALAVAANLVSDRGPRLAELWTDWQLDDARAVLDPEADAPRRHWLSRPKGGSKDTDVAALGLGWLLIDAGPHDEAYVIGADKDQGNRLLNRARGFVQRSGLDGVVKVEATSIVNATNGARIDALAADVAGGEGLLSPLIVVEELPNWDVTQTAKSMWTLAVSSIPKWPGMTFVVIGHAGAPEHWSFKLYEHARVRASWRFSHVDGPLPWIDAGDLDDQRALLLPSQFARRHLNEWATSEGRLSTRDDVLACVGHDRDLAWEPGFSYVVTLDLGLVNDRTVACVAHRDVRGRVAVDRLAVWEGKRGAPVRLEDVEAWVAQACFDYRARLLFDPYQAVMLAQRLKARGVVTTQFTFSSASVGRLAAALFNALRDRALDLPDDAALIDELCNVQLRETSPGVVRMDHAPGQHDDRAIAVAMAVLHFAERSTGGEPSTATATTAAMRPLRGRSSLPSSVWVNPRIVSPGLRRRELTR